MKIINRIKLSLFKIDKKSIVFALPILFFLMISFIVINADTTPVSSVEINSNYSGQGSWTITKSAEWTDLNKARITLELNTRVKLPTRNKDIIFVIDVSGSMSGSKLDKLKEDAKDLIDTLLTDSNNRVAIITFSSTASKLSDLTNNASNLDTIIDNLTASGDTNYNAGLLEAKSIISNYTQINNKDLVLLFLTDGYPNKETPNQASTFEIMKEEYPFVTYSAVQYEMGKDVVKEIESISDNQYVAYEETLNNVLFEACVSPAFYDSLSVEDYISSYFEISSITDINPSYGSVNLTTESGLQKISWNLGSNYRTGRSDTLTIDVNLKSPNQNVDSVFETNDHEVITSKLTDDTVKTVNSSLTPILPTKYSVIYQTNTPTGCALSNIPSEKYKPYETVTIRNDELSCSGYVFKGYEIEGSDVTKINSKKFIMPNHNTTIRAIWTKADITASMDGEVATGLTLYKVIRNEYKSNSGSAALYTGEHKDSFNRPAEKEIYYYKYSNIIDKTNVIFAGFCWQMFRTTDTGGVKMIYNGIPVDGKCEKTRTNANGLLQNYRTTESMSGTYYYGSDFTYDLTNATYKLSGTTVSTNYSSDKSVIGMYTCKNANVNATCSTLYYLEEEGTSNTNAYVYPLKINSTNYAQIGYSPFNDKFQSIARVGYMYNKAYDYIAYDEITNNSYISSSRLISYSSQPGTTLYYSDSIDIGNLNANQYTLINPVQWQTGTTNLVGTYSMNNKQNDSSVQYISAATESSIYVHEFATSIVSNTYYYGDSYDYGETAEGKYSITNGTPWSYGINIIGKYVTNGISNSDILYVIGQDGSRIYYEKLSKGNKLKYNESITLGDSIVDIGNNNYELSNTISLPFSDWITNYASYKYKYTCGDSNNICSAPRYITSTSIDSYNYLVASKEILIAKTRNGLELTNTVLVRLDELSKNRANYSDYKYTCNTTSSTCTEGTLRMITSFNEIYYTYAVNRYFGESVTWNGTNYTLNNVVGIESATNMTDLSTHHYTCLNPIGTQCASVGYIYYYRGSDRMYYILLENGVETVSEVLEEMLHDNNVNVKDSSIKRLIEEWYYNNLVQYDSYLEETVYCNDRSIEDIGGWDDNGGLTSNSLDFKNSSSTIDFSCSAVTDKFSVNNNAAKLKYKIGLITNSEAKAIDSIGFLKTGSHYWTISPREYYWYSGNSKTIDFVSTEGKLNYSATGTFGVRPVISLAPGVAPSSGTGTMIDPYVIDTSGN